MKKCSTICSSICQRYGKHMHFISAVFSTDKLLSIKKLSIIQLINIKLINTFGILTIPYTNITVTHRQKLQSSHFLKLPLSTALISGIIHSNSSEKILKEHYYIIKLIQCQSRSYKLNGALWSLQATTIDWSFDNLNACKTKLKKKKRRTLSTASDRSMMEIKN